MTPLATLLRPQTINDIVGQENLLQPDGVIRKMVDNKFVSNLIFYGPPGVGKTSFANALAMDLGYEAFFFNASVDKKDKIDKILSNDKVEKKILIIDEVHRMNKGKQDLLLEYMESGNIICFFTTTENPYFTINPAIRSRSTILALQAVSVDDIFKYLKDKIASGQINLKISDEPLMFLAEMSGGDLRVALNKTELLLNLYNNQNIDVNLIKRIFDSKANLQGSKYGDIHYDLMSALQKSIRGSDPDAGLYWMARMLETGDTEALLRRMTIMAYEDIGMANPSVGMRVFNACEAFRQIGLPQGAIPLGLAVVEMALSEKSNSAYLATLDVVDFVQKGGVYEIPSHLRDDNYASANKLNKVDDYKYAHEYLNDYIDQQYLPDEIKDMKFYHPKRHPAYEKKILEVYEKFTNKKL